MSAETILDEVATTHGLPWDADDKLEIACEYIDYQNCNAAFEKHVEIRAAQYMEEGSDLPRDPAPSTPVRYEASQDGEQVGDNDEAWTVHRICLHGDEESDDAIAICCTHTLAERLIAMLEQNKARSPATDSDDLPKEEDGE